MKKALSIMLALTFLVIAPLLVHAKDYGTDPLAGKPIPELQMTAEQKTKMISLKTQVLELRKQIVKDNVAKGTITKEQAQIMEDRINARLKALEAGDLGHPRRNHPPKGKLKE